LSEPASDRLTAGRSQIESSFFFSSLFFSLIQEGHRTPQYPPRPQDKESGDGKASEGAGDK